MMTDTMQRAAYEAFSMFGPEWSAIFAGFAVWIGGRFYLTPAGERYLEQSEPAQ